MLLFAILPLAGAFIAQLAIVAAAPAHALRQATRYDVVKRATQTRPKRATVSGGALCTTFYLQDANTGQFVRDGSKGPAGSTAYAYLDTQGPVDALRLDGTRLVFTGSGLYLGASINANSVRGNIFAGQQTALVCALGPDSAVLCRRDFATPGSFDAEFWSTNGNTGTQILGIGTQGIQRRIVAVCA